MEYGYEQWEADQKTWLGFTSRDQWAALEKYGFDYEDVNRFVERARKQGAIKNRKALESLLQLACVIRRMEESTSRNSLTDLRAVAEAVQYASDGILNPIDPIEGVRKYANVTEKRDHTHERAARIVARLDDCGCDGESICSRHSISGNPEIKQAGGSF